MQIISSAIGNAPPPSSVVKALTHCAKNNMLDEVCCCHAR